MKLQQARVQKYRSIRDSGFFDVETQKTILVGPNEAGKTVLLKALEQLNPPDGVDEIDPLRDFPRSELSNLKLDESQSGTINPENVTIVEAHFELDEENQEAITQIDKGFRNCTYIFGRRLDNSCWHRICGGPTVPTYGEIRNDLLRLASHVDAQVPTSTEGAGETVRNRLNEMVVDWEDSTEISCGRDAILLQWLNELIPLIDEDNTREGKRFDKLTEAATISGKIQQALAQLRDSMPVFVYFSNYFRVRPRLHLGHLADRLERNSLDDSQYDRGNECLLKLLGFEARELSNLGKAAEPSEGDKMGKKIYEDQLDRRRYQLNSASIRLTKNINEVWQPDPKKIEADRLRVEADQQYLKVVVEDELGVEVELDQRSEGFQWLVSFFVVFFAEAVDRYQNAILLLDEPGLSLHGLKQREFRTTISQLAKGNQTLYTTHSPFMVGPDELDLVRVVEMSNRTNGTEVHTTVTAGDSAALLPLQEALGYDLAQSLFGQRRNLVLEGLTDYWYVEATAALLREAGVVTLNEKISLVPASNAGKVVYFATILHANNLKVAALLDSDSAGDAAATMDTLIHTLGNTNILRTADVYTGSVKKPEIEDLLRSTLIKVAKSDLGWDIKDIANQQPARSVIDIFTKVVGKRQFSKYRLAKAYLRWTQIHSADDLDRVEHTQWLTLINNINRALK